MALGPEVELALYIQYTLSVSLKVPVSDYRDMTPEEARAYAKGLSREEKIAQAVEAAAFLGPEHVQISQVIEIDLNVEV
jgi:hypothetical protein